tara:strand:- start:1206 stop:1379 length:174 start_codon:yes stop_codon:yes gene_type:complete
MKMKNLVMLLSKMFEGRCAEFFYWSWFATNFDALRLNIFLDSCIKNESAFYTDEASK